MHSDILSLTDYIHAFQVVLQRLVRSHPDPRTVKLCAEAARILQRVDAAHLRRGVGSFEQAAFERFSGQRLPSRVVFWLGECSRRMAAGEFAALAAHILHLCRSLEWMFHLPPTTAEHARLRITDLDCSAAAARTGTAPASGSFRGNLRQAVVRTRRC